MYVRVPEHLQTPLLKELQQIRRRFALKAFPLAVLFVSGLVALVFFRDATTFRVGKFLEFVTQGSDERRRIVATLG